MRPSVRINDLVANINYFARLLGLEILVPRLKLVPRTWFLMMVPVSYTIFCVHWTVKQTQHHWMDGLKSVVMLGGLINGCCQLITILQRHSDIKQLLNNIIAIYAEYEHRGADYWNALHLDIARMLNVCQIIRIGYLVSFVVMCAMPGIFLLYDGRHVTIMQYEIPGLPIDTNLGYILTYVQHLISTALGGLFFYMGDLMVLLSLMQILPFAHIFQLKAAALNDALHHKEQSRYLATVGVFVDTDVDVLLLDLINWHQLFTDYCQIVEHTFDFMIAAQVLSSAISILVCFCVNLSGFHSVSTIYLLVSAYSMLVYCIVGTQVEYAISKLIYSISMMVMKNRN
ncbi:GH13800 [Drosophila grimshawi]|uniref:GH13800 n=1 Tax=Drosophila grimshawi TaxID=7222 RepID=B4JR14_DROGR|nr:GH13800 [Drosophila grimshawi]